MSDFQFPPCVLVGIYMLNHMFQHFLFKIANQNASHQIHFKVYSFSSSSTHLSSVNNMLIQQLTSCFGQLTSSLQHVLPWSCILRLKALPQHEDFIYSLALAFQLNNPEVSKVFSREPHWWLLKAQLAKPNKIQRDFIEIIFCELYSM